MDGFTAIVDNNPASIQVCAETVMERGALVTGFPVSGFKI